MISMPTPSHVRLPSSSVRVEDVDEEVYDLYSSIPTSSSSSGSNLGIFSATDPTTTVRFDIFPPTISPTSEPRLKKAGKHSGRSKGGSKAQSVKLPNVELEFVLSQKLEQLRGKGGDTGSVIWRTSHHLLNFILPQLYFPASFTDPPPLLPDPQSLNVVELGSGCGLAAVAFSRFFRRYTCTDQFDCLKNLEANLVSNGLTVEYGEGWAESSSGDGKRTVGLKELDWVELVQQQLPSGNKASSASTSTHSASILPSSAIYDIILAADCIYNPFLILPFLSTIAHLSQPNHTVVLVAIELRSQEVTEEFLAAWLEETETRGAWEVWRIKDFQPDGGSVHALWAAWRKR